MAANPLVDIVLPLYNEEKALSRSVHDLLAFLTKSGFPYRYTITLANNASTDSSSAVATDLSREFSQVRVLDLDRKGKGLAVRTAWQQSVGDILAFMDVDLSSDLRYFRPLIDALAVDGCDLAIGNRRGRDSQVFSKKSARKIASAIYNALVQIFLGTSFADHQCGFKAMKKEAFMKVAPDLREDGFFFDTELLAFATKRGLSARSIDIIWRDSSGSKVSLLSDSVRMFYDIIRLRRRIK